MENRQSAYNAPRFKASNSVESDVFEAVRCYLTEDLGRTGSQIEARAQQEVERKIARSVLDYLAEQGIAIEGTVALDLGAGLGSVSEELILRGAEVISLEPGEAWAEITRRRVERHAGSFRLLRAFGEEIPLPDSSVDLIVSYRVLEHVRKPDQVLAEAWRILRPGGHFYLTCENYLAFHEAHYDVPWVPLLPKALGAIYLRLLGRSPQFLLESVTYTTYPRVLRECRRIGFVRDREEKIKQALREKRGPKWDALRLLSRFTAGQGALYLDRAARTFKFGFEELFLKPI